MTVRLSFHIDNFPVLIYFLINQELRSQLSMEPIEQGNYYHIYNRAAGKGNLFRAHEDFTEFIERYFYYLYPCVQTFAWCLLNNHFHAMIRIRTHEEQSILYSQMAEGFQSDKFHGGLDPKLKPYNSSRQLSHLINSYTRYFNKKYDRTGTLIEGPLKRKKVVDNINFYHLICYIHRNPIHHRITKTYSDYKHCSYLDFLTDKESLLEREEVIKGFGGKKNFIQAHEEFRLKIDGGDGLYLE